MNRVAFLMLACALTAFTALTTLTACSDSGNNPYANAKPGNGDGTKPTTPGQTGDKTTAGPNALMESAWCTAWHNQGHDYQIRESFINPEDFETHVFLITAAGRGPEDPQFGAHGNYRLEGAALTVTYSEGRTVAYTVRIDPKDPISQAKKLHLSNADGDLAFDPCM